MIRLSSSEISLEGLRTSPERPRTWACCDIGGRPPGAWGVRRPLAADATRLPADVAMIRAIPAG
jgi:hypothetical protein